MWATPRMLQYLLRRHENEHKRNELLFAINTAATVNYSMGAPKAPASPMDFMPSYFGKIREQSEEEIAENVRDMFDTFKDAYANPNKYRA